MMVDLKRHSRFFMALAVGSGVMVASLALPIARPLQALLGVNGFFLAYLALVFRMAYSTTPADLKRFASADDEGITIIVLLAIAAVCVSLGAILWVLNGREIGLWQAALALLAVPLGWATLHTLIGFHYAHLFYSGKSGGGLAFPGTLQPGIWDFLYLSFGVGMTAQVSDVVVQTTQIRKLVLGHAIGAFYYNAIILALAVNAGLALGN